MLQSTAIWFNTLLTQRVLLLTIGFAAAAFGQPSMFPASVRIGAVAGGKSPLQKRSPCSPPGAAGPNADFDLSVRYSGDTSGWLSTTPVHGTTPIRFTISADPSNLAAGIYSAQVFASVGSLHLSTWTNVSFTVAPAGSNPGGLSVSPSSLTFMGDSISTAQTITVSNGAGAIGALTISTFANPVDWVNITQSDPATPGNREGSGIYKLAHSGDTYR